MMGFEIADAAARYGFEAGSLSIQQAMEAFDVWNEYAKESPFAWEMEAILREMEGASSILMLALPFRTYEGYPAGVGWVSGYYAASHLAYTGVQALAREFELGGVAARTTRLPLKPLARAAGFGDYGRNGVIVREGKHIALQALLLEGVVESMPKTACTPMPCASCGACERACPTGALAGGLVDASRCLRNYMDGKEAPPELAKRMGDRLLGCDECLNACPRKEREAMPENWAELFSWEALLNEERYMENRAAIGEIIGANYARSLKKAAEQWLKRQA